MKLFVFLVVVAVMVTADEMGLEDVIVSLFPDTENVRPVPLNVKLDRTLLVSVNVTVYFPFAQVLALFHCRSTVCAELAVAAMKLGRTSFFFTSLTIRS